tara:strand:+ start:234 stop:344 length:111 start_codon:yes stop_codon:yes gene_type:complete
MKIKRMTKKQKQIKEAWVKALMNYKPVFGRKKKVGR